MTPGEVVYLNVGGVYFATTATTLRGAPYFSCLLMEFTAQARSDCIFIDRDPTHFRYVLNWVRGCTCLPDSSTAICELLFEADYYGLDAMVSSLWAQADLRRIPLNRRPAIAPLPSSG